MLTWHQAISDPFFAKALLNNSLKNLFYKGPRALLHYCMHVYMLADLKQPVWTYKSTKKGKLSMEHTALGELTETPGHAWPRVHPNT
jgi:hypothetical protein